MLMSFQVKMHHRHNNSIKTIGQKKIAYILGSFPCLTTTFIDREILEANRQGVHLVLVSIRPPGSFEMREDVRRLADKTKYILPVPWFRFLRAILYFGLTRLWTFLLTFIYLLTRHHDTVISRIKTIFHFAEGVWAAALLRPERIDHIHAHFAGRAAVVAMVASKLLKVPYSLTAHANDIYVSPVMLPEKIAKAKFVTTCTRYNKTHLERETGRQIELVYHGLDLSVMDGVMQPSICNGTSLILSVGRLSEKKGFPYLIKACHLLQVQGYDFRCEIVGDGPNRSELETLITELQLEDRVILCGALPNSQVMAKYTQATLFVLPCIVAGNGDRDGIPNVLLEAMASQVPVLSTRVSGIPEVIVDAANGLLVGPGDEQALAEAMARLLNDGELRAYLAENGRRRVKERFDIRLNIHQLVELLEQT
jgi:glycosyltransferase involved in cell wall biosynthesis